MRRDGNQEAFAAALLDPALPVPAGVVTAHGTADAGRFAVYRNNVAVGLRAALETRFPVTAALVGRDFFAGMARAYVAGQKPASPLMHRYGDDFGDFVDGFAPAASVSYLGDVVRVEAAVTRAYHAADVAPLTIAALAAADAQTLPRLRLVAHPAATLVASRFPAGSIWHAHQAETVQALTAGGAEAVLVVRPDYETSVHVIPQRDAAFAAALLLGAGIAEAAEQAAATEADFDFGSALVGLIGLGAFADLADMDQGG